MILLLDDDYSTGSVSDLPSNKGALTISKGEIPVTELTASSFDVKINDTQVIAWYKENKWDWFIDYVKDKLSDNHFSAENLETVKKGNRTAWKYLDIKHTQIIIFNDQTIPVKVVGDLNLI